MGERQYLWNILESENPWGLSNNKQRNATWTRAAEKVVKPGHVDVTDEQGKRTVEVDVCKGTVSFWRWWGVCGCLKYIAHDGQITI